MIISDLADSLLQFLSSTPEEAGGNPALKKWQEEHHPDASQKGRVLTFLWKAGHIEKPGLRNGAGQYPIVGPLEITASGVAHIKKIQQEKKSSVDSNSERTVFVVHGRNNQLNSAMFAFLRSLDLRPMEWTEAVAATGQGSPYIGNVLDSAFERASAIVVLLTPDEVTYLRPEFSSENDPETNPSPQARPNVLFEAGMAYGRNPDHTILVEVGDLRPFSDISGRHAVRLNNSSAKRQELANRLRTAGCAVDLTGTDWQTTGDFEPPPPPGNGLPLGRRIPSQSTMRRPVDFAVEYKDRGAGPYGKLQIINRGPETAMNVEVVIPEDAALSLLDTNEVVEKIPGNGKSVTLDAENQRNYIGEGGTARFDIQIRATAESGDPIEQSVFLDLNG